MSHLVLFCEQCICLPDADEVPLYVDMSATTVVPPRPRADEFPEPPPLPRETVAALDAAMVRSSSPPAASLPASSLADAMTPQVSSVSDADLADGIPPLNISQRVPWIKALKNKCV